MNVQALLVEILTEELPPLSLAHLSESFGNALWDGLAAQEFLSPECSMTIYATPRRLAVFLSSVRDKQPDQMLARKGPSVKSGYDVSGQPTQALIGFARSIGVDPSDLEQEDDSKGRYFVARIVQHGQMLDVVLAGTVSEALKKLPIPRLMRWGENTYYFVRPVHGLVMLFGDKVVQGSVLGQSSGRSTWGHRYMGEGLINISDASSYESELDEKGKVIASFARRRNLIVSQLEALALEQKARVFGDSSVSGKSSKNNVSLSSKAAECLGDDGLLDEVTALVEHPKAYLGHFEGEYLNIPAECLALTMKQNQKYFPLVDQSGKLLPQFIMVANLEPGDGSRIVHGNERVLRARLSDARFFFEQDRKRKLEDRVQELQGVVYHNKLGSMLDRVLRLQTLTGKFAREFRADKTLVQRAAWLSKADLVTGMVGEFPELQGVMGAYYALCDSEEPRVAQAIEEHYHPRFAGDDLPVSSEGACLALADKLDMLVGFFSIGFIPTGDKDPFGLRRHAIGVLRILVEMSFQVPLPFLLECTVAAYHSARPSLISELYDFLIERLKFYLRDRGYASDEIDAVTGISPSRLDQLPQKLAALQKFRQMPQSQALAVANKRIQNLLSKSAGIIELKQPESAAFLEPAEINLHAALIRIKPMVEELVMAQDWTGALVSLASIRPHVDQFFDEVMVMVDDIPLRENRLRLLAALSGLFNQVADISRLAS